MTGPTHDPTMPSPPPVPDGAPAAEPSPHEKGLIDYGATRLASTLQVHVDRLTTGAPFRSIGRELADSDAGQLWDAIRFHTQEISFPRFEEFVQRVLCERRPVPGSGEERLVADVDVALDSCFVRGSDLYEMLKTAAEVFLLLRCGVCSRTGRILSGGAAAGETDVLSATGGWPVGSDTDLAARLRQFLGNDRSSYIRAIVKTIDLGGPVLSSPFCAIRSDLGPCLLELIWSYWHEEGMLVQSMNALSLRFQNVRRRSGLDPLAELELDPLRPLNGFLWGYVQDEVHRLSVMRRAYEYNHHYGLTLYGKAVPEMRPADPRLKFLEAFHELLRQCALFYREAADNTVTPDPFPLLVSLKAVHLILSEGAHNQFRDLPWTARVEMLVQQWLLARPETRDFLRGRRMVRYPENWMGAVDAMKRLQRWSDVSVTYFNDLAVFGERLLLSIRYVDWGTITDGNVASDWALSWRPEIQGYLHAYRMVTGVNLSDEMVEVRRTGDARYLPPSVHLQQRQIEQQEALNGNGSRQLGTGNGTTAAAVRALPRPTRAR